MPEYRDPPVATPRPYGLFSVVSPTQKPNGPWATGAEWEPEACGIVINYANALCSFVGTNEVQTMSITGTPTGGSYRLTFYGQQTAAITYNANAAAVTTALNNLANVEPGDITVTGTYPNFTLTFGGQYAAEDVPAITAQPSLTGGTSPNITMATTTGGVRTAKVRTSPSAAVTSDPFSIYVLRECRTVGDYDRAQAAAMKMLTLGEQAAVEKEMWTRMSSVATNITPATPPSPKVGLAMLEEAIGDRYFAKPTIHASLDLSSLLTTDGAAEKVGQHLETGIGSNFVAGAGYPRLGPGGAPAAGSEWLIATGGMFVDRGTAFVQGPMVVQAPLDNTQVVLAERTYVAGWDCTPIAIRVTFP